MSTGCIDFGHRQSNHELGIACGVDRYRAVILRPLDVNGAGLAANLHRSEVRNVSDIDQANFTAVVQNASRGGAISGDNGDKSSCSLTGRQQGIVGAVIVIVITIVVAWANRNTVGDGFRSSDHRTVELRVQSINQEGAQRQHTDDTNQGRGNH